MLPKLFAPILMTLGILVGVQLGKTTSSNSSTEVDFFSFEKNFVATVAENLPWKITSAIPKIQEPEPSKLPAAEIIPAPNLQIKAGISADENSHIYYEKNINQKLPIASITKLITALVVLDNLNQKDIATISKNAVDTYGEMGDLVVNEKISVKNLLYIMLIDSSNDAAIALAEAINQTGKNIVELMNAKAKILGLANSSFSDSAGLNPDNFSTAADLFKLTNIALKNPLIREVIGTEETDVFSADNKIKHHLKNTNKLLSKIDGIIGGKTGYTEEAGECLILAVNHLPSKTYFITVILGAEIGTRFQESEKLINWTKKIYRW